MDSDGSKFKPVSASQKFRKIEYAKQIYTRGIKEICQINVTDDFIEIGSGIQFSHF